MAAASTLKPVAVKSFSDFFLGRPKAGRDLRVTSEAEAYILLQILDSNQKCWVMEEGLCYCKFWTAIKSVGSHML